MRYLLFCTILFFAACQSSSDHESEIYEWRKNRIESLTAPIGWASLSGLHWIKGDTTSLGGKDQDITFDEAIDFQLANVIRNNEGFLLQAIVPGITESGEEFVSTDVHTDQDSLTSRFNFQKWQWIFIERGGKMGLRLWDTTHVNRSKFLELDYYPINPLFKVEATFKEYDPPLEKSLQNVLGMTVPQVIPGELHFDLNGTSHSLQVLNGTEEEFFIIFADETTGGETYGGGRYLYSPKPQNGSNQCIIDFNKAYTPPCGFTEFATCLLPSRENTLEVEITAGETYHFDH